MSNKSSSSNNITRSNNGDESAPEFHSESAEENAKVAQAAVATDGVLAKDTVTPAKSLTAEDKQRLFKNTVTLLMIGVLFILMAVVYVGMDIVLLVIVGGKGSEYVATLGALRAMGGFLMSVFGFIYVGVSVKVGQASGAMDNKRVGSIFRVSTITAFVLGLIGMIVLLSMRIQLLEWFGGEEEKDVIVKLGGDAAIIFAIAFLPGMVDRPVDACLVGLMFLYQTLGIDFSAFVVVIVLTLGLYDSMDISALGIAALVAALLSITLRLAMLFGPAHRRERFSFFQRSGNEKEIFLSMGQTLNWVALRSITNETRGFLSILFMTRISLVHGASYMVLVAKTGFVSSIAGLFAIGFNFMGSRIWGSKNKDGTFILFDFFFEFLMSICFLFTLLHLLDGPDALIGNVLTAEEDTSHIATPEVFALFIIFQPIRTISALNEHAVLVVGEERYAGLSSLMSFLVFLAIAIPGQSSFTTVYAAEVVAFFVRVLLVTGRLCFHGWRPGKFWTFPRGVDFDSEPEWRVLCDEAREKKGCRGFFDLRLKTNFAYIAHSMNKTFTDPAAIYFFGGGAKEEAEEKEEKDIRIKAQL